MSAKTISGFTTTYNCFEMHYPFTECIRSLLGFCDEVSIVDAGSTDGTLEALAELQKEDSRIKIAVEPVDFTHPRWAIYQDGYLKAKARANCTSDYCWQTDTDEIVADHDYQKIRALPDLIGDTPLIMLPMIEFWGSLDFIRADFFSWKPRFSINDPRITHGIPKDMRCYDQEGHEYPRPFDSDSCNYIYRDTLEGVKIVVPVELQDLNNSPLGSKEYEKLFNSWLDFFPAVYHVSWLDLRRKILHYKKFWRRFHASMYNLNIEDTAANNVMFDKPWGEVTADDIKIKAEELKVLGPRFFHKKMDLSRGPMMPLSRKLPAGLKAWYEAEKQCYEAEDKRRAAEGNSPLVSAIVPIDSSSGVKTVLDKAIKSLLSQNYQNIEILAINDGGEAQVVEAIEQARRANPGREISLINKKRGGKADAKNFGIRQARGKYIVVLDSEDLLAPDFIAKGISYLKSSPSNVYFSKVDSPVIAEQGTDPYLARYRNPIPKGAIFDRMLWIKAGGFNSALPFSDDWDFWLRCLKEEVRPFVNEEPFNSSGLNGSPQPSSAAAGALVKIANDGLFPVEEVLEAQRQLETSRSEWGWQVEMLEQAHPNEWLAKFLFGLSVENSGHTEKAMQLYAGAIEKSQYKSWQPIYRLALILNKQRKLKEANELLHSVKTLRPDMARVLSSLFVEA